MECWSSAVILLWSSTWLIQWGPSRESWIISAEASWLGLAGALMMWYRSEPELVFVPCACECGCICLCGCVSVSLCVHGFCLCGSLYVYMCVCIVMCVLMYTSALVCVQMNKCMCTRVCVCLLPSAPSNRLIFHISHGQEGQEAARLRPEPGYSTVSNARHSLAPPKLSALLPNALASYHALAPCSLLSSPQ